jgi:tight adherence protein C
MNMLNTTEIFILLGGLLALLGLILSAYGIITWIKRAGRLTTRMDQYVAPPLQTVDPKASPIIPREISGSLLSRTIGNALRKMGNFLERFAPKNMLERMEHQLTIADHPNNLHAGGFFALRVLLLGTGLLLAFLINQDLESFNPTNLLLSLLLVIILWIYPIVWLRGKIRVRQDEIQRGLPDALDMLSVCASAGLGFDQSIQRISEYWDTELGHELVRVTHEMEMGIPRSEALRNMSARLDVDDLTRFIATIVQAERIGMSYANVLHSQALQMRVLRQLRAREIANQLPGKMIIPVALFIFPAMLVVILGPAIPTIMSIF